MDAMRKKKSNILSAWGAVSPGSLLGHPFRKACAEGEGQNRMAIDDYGERVETSEQLVLTIREKLIQLDSLRPESQDAMILDKEIRNLVQVLLKRHERLIASYARQLTSAVPSLFEDAVSEITFELIKAIKSPTRHSLTRGFVSRIRRIALDAYDRLKSEHKGTPGLIVRVTDGGERKDVHFESADTVDVGDEGVVGESLAERTADESTDGAFAAILSSVAYRQVAPKLTQRQRDVVEKKLQGLSDVRIAKDLDINRDTVAADIEKAIATIERNLAPQRVENL